MLFEQSTRLFEFQTELASPALRGLNTVICAPTGSGKTIVAAEIVVTHLKDFAEKSQKNRQPKVVFLVPTVPLVEQQARVLQRYLPRGAVGSIIGRDVDNAKADVLRAHILTVMTPKILVNLLEHVNLEKKFEIGAFSLILFDECHLTTKNHPYNELMRHYMQAKHRPEPGDVHLPQVVGLTASLGVGKADGRHMALDHVVSVAANLDCERISAVRSKRGLRELRQRIPAPIDELEQVPASYKIHPFSRRIEQLMTMIEDKLRRQLTMIKESEGGRYAHQVRQLKLQQAVEEDRRGRRKQCWMEEVYVNWWSIFRQQLIKLPSSEHKNAALSCLEFLKDLRDVLVLNAHVPVEQAREYLDECMRRKQHINLSKHTDELLQDYANIKPQLMEINEERFTNSLATALRRILTEDVDHKKGENSHHQHRNGEHSYQVFVFVSTRLLTRLVCKYLQNTPEIQQRYNPQFFVSANVSEDKYGMTSEQQERILSDFRQGVCKLLVSSDIAAQGLDIQKANMIVKYNHTSNEIDEVQRKGRARQHGSRSILLTQEGSLADRAMVNQVRVNLMNAALEDYYNRGWRWFCMEVKRKQLWALEKREKTAALQRKLTEKDHTILGEVVKCDQNICTSDTIRTAKDSLFFSIDASLFSSESAVNFRPATSRNPYSDVIAEVACSKCGNKLGNLVTYRGAYLPSLKAEELCVIKDDNERRTETTWKAFRSNVFPVDTVTDDELVSLFTLQMAQASSDGQDLRQIEEMTETINQDDSQEFIADCEVFDVTMADQDDAQYDQAEQVVPARVETEIQMARRRDAGDSLFQGLVAEAQVVSTEINEAGDFKKNQVEIDTDWD